MIRPPDPWAEAHNDLAASRIRSRDDFVERRMEVTCPVCGGPCSRIGREAILLVELDQGWKCYRPGRVFWQHEDRTCITHQERSKPREGDVVQTKESAAHSELLTNNPNPTEGGKR